MDNILIGFVMIMAVVIVIGVVNEKLIKMPNDIALVLFSFLLSALLELIVSISGIRISHRISNGIKEFHLDELLLNGVLCFMLFAGASKVHYGRFMKNFKAISLLALLTTVLSSFVYGGLFYLINRLLGLELDVWLCVLLGCIVSPTDPIAATSILNKLGLSKNVTSVIEGESLFNDGTGVALFVCIKNIVNDTSEYSFLELMGREILGALAIGIGVSFVMCKLLRSTKDPTKHIMISLFSVSCVYVVCEYFEFSGVIASVVCGMFFAKQLEKYDNWRQVVDPENFYLHFWDVADALLNSMLFVLIGFSILYIPNHSHLIWLLLSAVVLNFIARFVGVYSSTLLIGKKRPNQYSRMEFTTLMTWSGLKGGLSLALALSTISFLDQNAYEIVMIITYTTLFFTTVVQGLTTSKIYKLVERSKLRRKISRIK